MFPANHVTVIATFDKQTNETATLTEIPSSSIEKRKKDNKTKQWTYK